MNYESDQQAAACLDAAVRTVMPLMNSPFPVGKCREFIETIQNEHDRAIAWGEYYYYSGQAELAAKTMEPYQDSADPILRHSANLVGFFSNFTRGYTQLSMDALEQLQTDLREEIRRAKRLTDRPFGLLSFQFPGYLSLNLRRFFIDITSLQGLQISV